MHSGLYQRAGGVPSVRLIRNKCQKEASLPILLSSAGKEVMSAELAQEPMGKLTMTCF